MGRDLMHGEKMRAPRFALDLPVRYRPHGAGEWLEGRTQNISRTGVLFRAEDVLAVDTPIEMTLVLPLDSGPEVLCRGRVVRTVPPSESDLRPGLAATIREYRFTPREAPAA